MNEHGTYKKLNLALDFGVGVLKTFKLFPVRSEADHAQPLYINVHRFRGGLVFKAHRLVSLNSRLESNEEKKKNLPLCENQSFLNL